MVELPVEVVQHVHKMRPSQYGRHGVTEKRHGFGRYEYAQAGPMAVGPRGVQVYDGAQKADDQREFPVENSIDEIKHGGGGGDDVYFQYIQPQ